MKARSLTRSFLLVLEISDDQAPPWFEHTSDFREPLTLEGSRQMMHHQGREHHVERLIGERKLLDHPDLELDRYVAPSRFRTGTGDLLGSRVNACHAARTAYAACHFDRQRTRAAAYIQHLFSGLYAGQVDGPLPELVPVATEREGVVEPSHQVVAPTFVEDQPFCFLRRRLAR